MLSEGYGVSLLIGDIGDVNPWLIVVGVGVWDDSMPAPSNELFLRFAAALVGPVSLLPLIFLFATGLERPRSLPRLATPTPHVRVVL